MRHRTLQRPRGQAGHRLRPRHARRARGCGSGSRSSAARAGSGIEGDRTDARGRYRLRQRLRGTLSRSVRVRVRQAPGILPAKRRIGRLNVYRYAYASWYGPGLYGNRTGCGGTLYAGRLGVAHKSLPCGTMVTFKHGGRERARAGDRPRAVRRRARVRPDRGDRPAARLPRPRRRSSRRARAAALSCGERAGAASSAPASPPRRPRTPRRARRAGGPGRGGAYARSRSSATPATVAVSLTAAGSVRARVTVVQSSSRTLIAIVRPRACLRWSPSQSWPASRASTASSSARSAMSLSNVVSFERDLAGPGLRLDDVRAVEVRARDQLAAVARAEARRERRLVGPLERADRREAHRRQPLDRLRARCRG